MAIWTGDDYQIDKVSANTSSSAADSVGIAYLIEVQRLPSENYPDKTFISIARDVIPTSTADDALIGLILPQVNTAITAIDAAFDASDTSPTGDPYSDWTVNYTEKTGL
jgi:hypothetical protein